MSAQKRVVVATHNVHKVAEIRAILNIPGGEFVGLDELGISDEPVEDAANFVDNARIKARHAHEKTGLAALADDSGLVVDALGGAPGVYSSRYAGDEASDAANNRKLLDELSGIPNAGRTARFVCAMVYIDDDGTETVAEGYCEGRIGHELQGDNGFGYDPLFLPKAYNYTCSMAELSATDKNVISHRAQALKELAGMLTDENCVIDATPAVVDSPSVIPAKAEIPPSPVVLNSFQDLPAKAQDLTENHTGPTKAQIVAFDFDGTLINASSPVRLIFRLNRDRIMPKRNVTKSILWGIRYKMGRELDQRKPRRYVFASFRNSAASDANALMKDLYWDELRKYLRPQAVAELREHQAAGRHVIVVSASFEPIIAELCKDLGIKEYICTRMETIDGSYTGETLGEPPESEQKLIQFTQWANDHYGENAWEMTHAYGDHFSDVPLMEIARHPIAVDPDRRLEGIAKERGWEIHLWPHEVKEATEEPRG